MGVEPESKYEPDWSPLVAKRRRWVYSGVLVFAAFGLSGLLAVKLQSMLLSVITVIIWAVGSVAHFACWFAVYFAKCPACGGNFHRIPWGTSFSAVFLGRCAQCRAVIPRKG